MIIPRFINLKNQLASNIAHNLKDNSTKKQFHRNQEFDCDEMESLSGNEEINIDENELNNIVENLAKYFFHDDKELKDCVMSDGDEISIEFD